MSMTEIKNNEQILSDKSNLMESLHVDNEVKGNPELYLAEEEKMDNKTGKWT